MNVTEIQEKAQALYAHFLERELETLCLGAEKPSDSYFPLVLADFCTDSPACFEEQNQAENADVYAHSKHATGTGYALEEKTIHTRSHGRRMFIQRIFFETQDDFLHFTQKEAEIRTVYAALSTIKEHLAPEPSFLHRWAKENISYLTAPRPHAEAFWLSIADAAQRLEKNQPQDLPLDFITEHRALLQSLLPHVNLEALVNPPHEGQDHAQEQKKPFLVRFRSLSLKTPLVLGSLEAEEIALTRDDFVRLEKTGFLREITHILIIQNELSYLSFAHVEHTLCILGDDRTLAALRFCEWLPHFTVVFFADITERSLESLSALRTFVKEAHSLCMTGETLRLFAPSLTSTEPSPHDTIPKFLTAREREVFLALKHNPQKNCLAQEHIPLEYAAKEFAALFQDHSEHEEEV